MNENAIVADEKPSCPKCGIVARVRKQGVLQRATSTIQNYRCVSCCISFVDPSARLGHGPRRNDEAREEARALRAIGKTYGQIAEALHVSEHWAYTLCRFDFAANDPKPERMPQGPPGTSGTWKIPDKLARSLSAMFRNANGCTPTAEALDLYVSELLSTAIADFRLLNSGDIRHYGRPVMKIADPTK